MIGGQVANVRAMEREQDGDWPGELRRRPPRSSPTFLLRAPLAAWLKEEASRAGEQYGTYRVLDVGCGVKPYYPFFRPFVTEYVGVDVVDNPAADLHGPIERLPVPDGSFDVVLCTQVLEHCLDPPQAVRELRRVVAPGGRVLASTHGVEVYHPSPEDLWRWTHTGLERLFATNAEWASLTVRPVGGTTACLGKLLSTYVDLLARRLRIAPVGKLAVRAINRVAPAVDRRFAILREPRPGTLFVNYHVVAEAPKGTGG
jgi:SAM-dependent methyltransferase